MKQARFKNETKTTQWTVEKRRVLNKTSNHLGGKSEATSNEISKKNIHIFS